MKKKLLSILLCMALIFTMCPTVSQAAEVKYDLWVGGVQVTSTNKNNVLNDSISSVAYDPTYNILYLYNANITNNIAADTYTSMGIISVNDAGLTIEVTGTNTVTSASSTTTSLPVYGIYSARNQNGSLMPAPLTIQGTGSLAVNATGKYNDVYGIGARELTIKGGNITVDETFNGTGSIMNCALDVYADTVVEKGATLTLSSTSRTNARAYGFTVPDEYDILISASKTGSVTNRTSSEAIIANYESIKYVRIEESVPDQIFTVYFNAGEGTCSTKSLQTGVHYRLSELPEAIPPEGQQFLGWYTAVGDKVTLKKEYTSDTTLFARYDNILYTISVSNGSSLEIAAAKGETITVTAAPAPEGKVFDHWEVLSGGITLPKQANTTFTMPAADVSLKAVYADIPSPVSITSVDITVKAPRVGEKADPQPVSITTVPADAVEIYAGIAPNWYAYGSSGSFEIFEEDMNYHYIIRLVPKAGYQFDFDSNNQYTGTVRVNGYDITSAEEAASVAGGLYISTGYIKPSALIPVTKVNISIPEPVLGQTPLPSIVFDTEPVAAELTMDWDNSIWYEDVLDTLKELEDPFEEGKSYMYQIVLRAEEGYTFEGDEYSTYLGEAIVNGVPAYDAYEQDGGSSLVVYYRFGTELVIDGNEFTREQLKTDRSGTGWSWNAAQKKLLLNNYNGGYIRAYSPLNIQLGAGTVNTITVPKGVAAYGIEVFGDCRIEGSGSLTVDVQVADYDGIWAEYGDLTIDMGGKLTVLAGDDGIIADLALTISGSGDVQVSGGKGYGLYTGRGVTISGSGDVEITGGYHGIYCDHGDMILSGSGAVDVKVEGDYSYSAVLLEASGTALYFNGTAAPVSFTAHEGWSAVANGKDTVSPIAGTNLAYYNKVTGSPEGQYVIYDHENEEIKNGLVYEDGTFRYYENGVWISNKYGFVDFDGERFLVANGELAKVNGLYQDPNGTAYDWYFLAEGRIVKDHSGFCEYDGEWFIVQNGKLDFSATGYYEYDGGLFYMAEGRLAREAEGLNQDPVTKKWYFCAQGQAQTQYTGLALYDNEWFYIINGALAEDYSGTVEYNGGTFNVVNGMVKL